MLFTQSEKFLATTPLSTFPVLPSFISLSEILLAIVFKFTGFHMVLLYVLHFYTLKFSIL